MLFVEDIVFVGGNLEEVNGRLEEWKETIEGKGLRISRGKIEYIEYNFGKKEQIANRKMQVMK
jgi:hypothetical protein